MHNHSLLPLLAVAARLTPHVLGELLHDAAHTNQSLVPHRGFKSFGLTRGRLPEQPSQPRGVARDRIGGVSPWCRPRA